MAALFASTSLAAPGWEELPGTKLNDACPPSGFGNTNYNFANKCKNVTLAWGGGAFDPRRNRLYIWGGGHHDYYGNEVYALDVDARRLLRLTDPAVPLADEHARPVQSELHPFDGTQPNSRHTYGGLAFIEHADRLWAFSGALAARAGSYDNVTWLFDPQASTWRRDTPGGDVPDGAYGVVAAYDPATGLVFLHNRSGLYSFAYGEDGGTYTRLTRDESYSLHRTAVIDPVRRQFIVIGKNSGFYYDIGEGSQYQRQSLDFKGDTRITDRYQAPGLAYDPAAQEVVGWVGDGRIYRLDVATATWSATAFDGGPGRQPGQGTYGRFVYVPSMDGFAIYNLTNQNGFLFTPPRGISDTQAPTPPDTLTATAPLPSLVKLQWERASDNFGVDGYRVYRNGALIAQTSLPKHADLSAEGERSYEYHVIAVDSAGNESLASTIAAITTPARRAQLPVGDCSSEPELSNRKDVVFCEPWEDPEWWRNGYLNDPIVHDPRPAEAINLQNSEIVSDGCFSGSCLKVSMRKGKTGGLRLHWPLSNAELAPEELFLRYYIRLAPDWNPNMCDDDGNVVGSGGKFPGLADPRTWADDAGQCGNGGAKGDGLNCWSMRSLYRGCGSKDGEACATKPGAIARFGSYLYNHGQASNSGAALLWDDDDNGQSTHGGGSCQTNPRNMYCGIGDGGVLVPDRWYRMEMQVRMNTPGEEDGVIRGWVDGVLSYEKTNVVFRIQEHDMLHNRVVWLNVFKGGRNGNCNDSAIFLDQLVLTANAPPGGLDSDTAQPPTLTFNAADNTVTIGDSTFLSWLTERADTCEADGAWSGPRPPQGSEIVAPSQATTLFDLRCSGPGGSVSRRVSLDVSGAVPPAPPTDGPDTTPPEIPPQPRPTLITSDRVGLEWDEPHDDRGVAGYRVFRNGLVIATVDIPSLEDHGLPAGTSFVYTVEAFDSAGNLSERSDGIELTTGGDAADPSNDEIALFPDSDTFTHPSTVKALGDSSRLILEHDANIYLRFPLSLIPKDAQIESAQLRLHANRQYGTPAVGVFLARDDWHERASTRDFLDVDARLPWTNANGDWIDSNGVLQGDVPFAELQSMPASESGWAAWDITDIAKNWHDGALRNQGMVLRTLNGIAQIFDSKESENSAVQPRLDIHLKRASTYAVEKAAIADTFLSESTHKSLGDWPLLYISSNSPTLVRFDLSDLDPGTTVEHAYLRLHTYHQSGGDLVAGVFLPDKPWLEFSATRSYYDKARGLPWNNYLGDWQDADMIQQGTIPFAEAASPNDGGSRWIEWEITGLVQQWLDGTLPNFGVLLRALSGGTHHFYSKDGSIPGFSPYLSLELR